MEVYLGSEGGEFARNFDYGGRMIRNNQDPVVLRAKKSQSKKHTGDATAVVVVVQLKQWAKYKSRTFIVEEAVEITELVEFKASYSTFKVNPCTEQLGFAL